MAVVWAKQAGSWTDATLWAFWNENTQQIEDYEQIPQVDDVVYCNGYIIMFNADINIGNGYIRNDVNPYTNLSGGYIQAATHDVSQSLSITANLLAYNDIVFYLYGVGNNTVVWIYNINGNVQGVNQYAIRFSAAGIRLTINGNIHGMFYQRTSGSGTQSHTLIINGNVTQSDNSYLIGAGNQSFGNVTINGNYSTATLPSPYKQPLFTINGRFSPKNGMKFDRNTTINGIIDVAQNNSILPIDNSYYILTQSGITMITSTDYPIESNVKKDIPYAFNQMVGTYDINQYLPPESVVLKDYEYGDSDDRKTGTMVQEVNVEVGCVTPEDVRKDVLLVGMGVVGTLVVPSVDDVREGVVFDNGSVGTLIVQGGGDRLRIADFGYYTNAQSDTYIVDLTEQDKPKFAVAEERVLIEMFPDLDLDNIPDKYFDDLFVKYLKYRLIVEYYRTAGINSTFTPSEPTTEIVNYQNVRNEVWLNSANIYLKAWGEKYPNSIKKQRTLL